MELFLQALTLRAGYNATLVTLGATAFGLAAGLAGTFLTLRRRALVADAMAHATLPGVVLAFVAMVALGGEGRALPGLMAGAAVTAALGFLAVEALAARTRLPEDAAIGAVLSVGFGLGVVLLTAVQGMQAGQQAGLQGFLLGSTAGMLRSEAVTVALGGAAVAAALFALRRPLTMVAFDAGHAATMGLPVRALDLALLALVLAITVTGLRIVGVVLVVAMLVIPAVAARFWSDRAFRVGLLAAALGGLSAWIGAALSAAMPDMPTGPVIVLVAAAVLTLSFVLGPARGIAAGLWPRRAAR